ncbi:MAG: class I SAM-dependent methyltransferase [Bacteroidales bacterium]
MTSFWDLRYESEEFVYGKGPNLFFRNELQKLKPGRLLLPGEGEGRNAVHAARQGWQVQAFDQSEVAARKALQFAASEGVRIDYAVSPLESFPFEEESADAVGLTYVHVTPEQRRYLHDKVAGALKPGGRLILEAFDRKQIDRESGGPRAVDMLFDTEELRKDFGQLDILSLEICDEQLQEGRGHRGEAVVIRLLAEKPR